MNEKKNMKIDVKIRNISVKHEKKVQNVVSVLEKQLLLSHLLFISYISYAV